MGDLPQKLPDVLSGQRKLIDGARSLGTTEYGGKKIVAAGCQTFAGRPRLVVIQLIGVTQNQPGDQKDVKGAKTGLGGSLSGNLIRLAKE